MINEFTHYPIQALIETMNKATGSSTDPRAKPEVDQITTAVINRGCFSCCLAVLSMISLAYRVHFPRL